MLFRLPLILFALAAGVSAQYPSNWTTPFPPHRIAGNLYYVGSEELASYLIVTPSGNILINSSLRQSVPLIQASIEKLGFQFKDTKILLISHAHWDHDAGSAAVKKMTGAKYMVMDGDVAVVESGGKADFQYGSKPENQYPATKVDRLLRDGDRVSLGGTTLIAHKTPGHTRGCTTWTMKVFDHGRTWDVVIVGSPNVNGGPSQGPVFSLVNNAGYPQIAQDFETTFRVLKSLPCDIFLGAHPSYYGMAAKYARLQTSGVNPFIDPDGYKKYVVEKEQAFRGELGKESNR